MTAVKRAIGAARVKRGLWVWVCAGLCIAGTMVFAALGRGEGPPSEPRDAVLQTVLKGLEWHESLFAAAEAYFTVESFYGSKYREEVAAAGNARLLPESGPGAKKYLWRSDGRRWYCEETRLLPPAACVGGGHRKWAFDGNEH